MLQKILLLALAGATGTIARYGLSSMATRIGGMSIIPTGTLAVNVTGCLIAGLIMALLQNKWPFPGETRAIIMIGFLGAFTTFSAFILETGELFRTSQWMQGVLNIFMQNGLGFVAFFGGFAIIQLMLGSKIV